MTRQAMQGVNLGGWLVAEKWMTPSLFVDLNASSEYQLTGHSEGRRRLKVHHDTFITDSDIAWLAEHRVDIVRVPYGHWIFGDRPPYLGSIERLDWLVDATARHGIKVLLDLHGAPEAQNAFEHSGSGTHPRDRRWLQNRQAQDATIEVLVRIAERYRDASNVWGIQLLNEPDPGVTGLKLARFYRRAYRAIIAAARPGTHIVFSDGYVPLLLTNALGLMTKRDYPAVMDCHFYQCFSRADKRRVAAEHLRRPRQTGRLIRFLAFFQPIIVGEWSAMLPFRADNDTTWRFWHAQEAAYDSSLAIFYWNYKTEGPGRWNYRAMIEGRKTASDKR